MTLNRDDIEYVVELLEDALTEQEFSAVEDAKLFLEDFLKDRTRRDIDEDMLE